MIAINDGILLRNHIHRILKKHFRGMPYYVDLVDLFNEVYLFNPSLNIPTYSYHQLVQSFFTLF